MARSQEAKPASSIRSASSLAVSGQHQLHHVGDEPHHASDEQRHAGADQAHAGERARHVGRCVGWGPKGHGTSSITDILVRFLDHDF